MSEELLEAIRDRLIAKQGHPSTNPSLDSRRVMVMQRGDGMPASPPYPHILVRDAGSTPTRHASRLKQVEDRVDVVVNTKMNLPRGAPVTGSDTSTKRARPAIAAIELAKQVEDLLDDWPVKDKDGNDLNYDVSEYLDREEAEPVEEGRVGTSSVTLHFRFVRFATHTQPT